MYYSGGLDNSLFHFVAFVPINGEIYEMDGMRSAPRLVRLKKPKKKPTQKKLKKQKKEKSSASRRSGGEDDDDDAAGCAGGR